MQMLGPKSLKNSGSHIDASHSRQPLVKGERLVRYEVNAVMLMSPRACCNHQRFEDRNVSKPISTPGPVTMFAIVAAAPEAKLIGFAIVAIVVVIVAVVVFVAVVYYFCFQQSIYSHEV